MLSDGHLLASNRGMADYISYDGTNMPDLDCTPRRDMYPRTRLLGVFSSRLIDVL
jgi:hypothetical protein